MGLIHAKPFLNHSGLIYINKLFKFHGPKQGARISRRKLIKYI